MSAVAIVAIIVTVAYAGFRWWGYEPVESGAAAGGVVIVGGVVLAMVLVLTQGAR